MKAQPNGLEVPEVVEGRKSKSVRANLLRVWRQESENLSRISHRGSGRAGPAGAGPTEGGAAISAGLKPRPSGSPLRASKHGEKSGL
jgi:hypothetical protein